MKTSSELVVEYDSRAFVGRVGVLPVWLTGRSNSRPGSRSQNEKHEE